MDYSKLEDYIVIESGCIIDNRLEKIGRGTYINEVTRINGCKTIGRYCSISHNVKIGVGSHPKEWLSTSPIFYSKSRGLIEDNLYENSKEDKDIIIKNDVWIGCNSVIMPGVIVGNGSIIAAGAIVTKNVPDYAIVGGVPAKIIGYRFENNIIEKLIQVEWWNKDIETLKKVVNEMSNINYIIRELNKIEGE